jgi:hypothetical protein
MKRAMVWAGAVVLAATVSACAPGPHTDDTMLRGTHNMPGPPKATGTMSNEVMPSRSPDCSPEALANMPPEHRQACERGR